VRDRAGSLASIEVQVPPALRPEAERRLERVATRQPGVAITVIGALPLADERPHV